MYYLRIGKITEMNSLVYILQYLRIYPSVYILQLSYNNTSLNSHTAQRTLSKTMQRQYLYYLPFLLNSVVSKAGESVKKYYEFKPICSSIGLIEKFNFQKLNFSEINKAQQSRI